MEKSKHFIFLMVGSFSHLAFVNAVEPLRIANRMSGKHLYSWSFMSGNGATATASNGTTMLVDRGFDEDLKCDRLFVVSGNDIRDHVSKPLLAVLRRARAKGIPLGAFCSGAYIFAKAGFLAKRKAALHWEFHPGFSEQFPDVSLVPGVFVEDGPFLTASGGYAAANLMLHLIAQDHGNELALIVSDQMVYNTVRKGSAEQKISFQARSGMRCAKLARAVSIMEDRMDCSVSISEIAAEVGLSTRQLERLFARYLNTTPKKHLTKLRLERARQLFLQTEMTVMEVSIACRLALDAAVSQTWKPLPLLGVSGYLGPRARLGGVAQMPIDFQGAH
jgi:transcriptional regulator GlxA family with amidase domain